MNKSQNHDRHALSISLRLRQLGETLLRDQHRIYALYALEFDPKCFPVFYQLSLHPEGMTIMELARALGVTHPAIIKQARALERTHWIQSKQVSKDLRKRLLVLTPKGEERLPELKAAWNDMHTCLSTALDSLKLNLLDAMDEVEPAFEARSFYDRVSEYKSGRLIRETQLVPCSAKEHWNYFEQTTEANMQKLPEMARQYFSSLLLNARQRIQQQGGWVWILEVNAKPAGTLALLHRGDQVYQLTWISVEENYRRQGLGRQLVEHAMQNARKVGGRRVFLESHAQYPEVNALFHRMNFRSFVRPAAHQHEAKLVLMERYL